MDAVNVLINAICVALNKEFGDSYKNYTESVQQGLQEPCFFIFCPNPTRELFLGLIQSRRRYFCENQFVVQYMPVDALQPNAECHAVAERLELCLEWINVNGNPLNGTKMHYEIVDGVLHFFVNYDMFVYRTVESTPMEEFMQDVKPKG